MADLYDLLDDLRKLRSGMDKPSTRIQVTMVRAMLDALISKYETVEFVVPPAKTRRNKTATSAQGAEEVAVRVGPQALRLLRAFADGQDGLTNYEAGYVADLLTATYWMRCSDLQRMGMIRPLVDSRGSVLTRKNPTSGASQEVREITAKGRAWLRQTSN